MLCSGPVLDSYEKTIASTTEEAKHGSIVIKKTTDLG